MVFTGDTSKEVQRSVRLLYLSTSTRLQRIKQIQRKILSFFVFEILRVIFMLRFLVYAYVGSKINQA